MTATLSFVKQKFNEYNQLCFAGQLFPLPIRISNSRTRLGQVTFRRTRKLFHGWQYSDFQLAISGKHDLSEQELEDIILHEMIHYYILSHQLQDTSAHGPIFNRIMNDINSRFGRHITISHHSTKAEQDKDKEIRQHLICITHLQGNHLGITVAAHTRIFQLWDRLPLLPEVLQCEWYTTKNPFFNRFPRSLSVKIYRITQAELDENIKNALPLERVGKTIRVKRQK